MRVERISWGVWIILALAIGAVIAWLHTTLGQATVTQTMSQTEFVQLLMRRPVTSSDGKEYPWVKSVTIYPAVEMEAAYARASTRKAPVTYQILSPAPGRSGWQYQAKSSLVDDPIDEFRRGPQPLQTFLSGLAQDRPWVKYQYAFWHEPRWTYAIWVGGCVLVIGIIWPITLRGLAKAGYAGSAEEEKRESFWKRWFGGKDKSAEGLGGGAVSSGGATTGSGTLSEDELQRIAAMEAGLRDFVGTQKEPGGEVEEKAEPEVKKLTGGPAEPVAAPEKKQEKKEYDGEFYPTATHVKKKHE